MLVLSLLEFLTKDKVKFRYMYRFNLAWTSFGASRVFSGYGSQITYISNSCCTFTESRWLKMSQKTLKEEKPKIEKKEKETSRGSHEPLQHLEMCLSWSLIPKIYVKWHCCENRNWVNLGIRKHRPCTKSY